MMLLYQDAGDVMEWLGVKWVINYCMQNAQTFSFSESRLGTSVLAAVTCSSCSYLRLSQP